ncbi:helix-turn-helix transcriptional regulator [Corynebacterium sp.]|uniref:helix-turn-helix domain-containing protein n=1 Tax=Corynebacterium sp. TaxID=1720 RepID=UPI0029038567|nr:helix-turn-helix transcriptional regulator [Corynebacterium sp.]MDU3110466.1 helix-turn-helix transcriptional regulator [Corynebacterium sp.]
MSSTRWWDYIEPIIGDMTMRDAAKKAGFNQSAFTRWKGGAKADPEFVVKFARAFNLNVLKSLVEAEFITEEEANLTEVAPQLDLAQVDAQELLDELQHRIDAIRYLLELEEGGDRKLAAIIDRSNVVDFQSARGDIPQDAVADHSPEEEEGDPSDYDA